MKKLLLLLLVPSIIVSCSEDINKKTELSINEQITAELISFGYSAELIIDESGYETIVFGGFDNRSNSIEVINNILVKIGQEKALFQQNNSVNGRVEDCDIGPDYEGIDGKTCNNYVCEVDAFLHRGNPEIAECEGDKCYYFFTKCE